MIKKFLIILLVLTSSINALQKSEVLLDDLDTSNLTLEIPSSKIITQNIEDKIELFWDKAGFTVKKNDQFKRVHSYDTDKLFRQIDFKKIVKYALFNKFKVSEMDNGEYVVRPHIEILGGGYFGANAGFFAGKFVVYFVSHGAIQVAALCTGPAYLVTLASLEFTFAPAIELASNSAAIGTGILGAVLTGAI